MSDERLVEQVRRGNEAAFEVVYDRHHRGILGFCRHMLRSQEEAEDAVQHTFISAHTGLVGSDKPIRLKAWLYTIARNRCLSMLRARREQAQLPDELPTAGLTEAVVEREDLRRLLADVHNLPEDQRAALVLSELGDLSHAEIGGIVGCQTVKVKALVFQARSSLLESKRASEISCQEIREELATAHGGALRRGPLRRHVRSCQGCSEFREQVVTQRKMLALALPVIPTLGLKHAVLASVGGGHAAAAGGAALGGGGAVGGGAAAGSGGAATAGGASVAAGGGGMLSAVGGATVAKVAAVAVVAVGGGAMAIDKATSDPIAPRHTKSEKHHGAVGGTNASKAAERRRALDGTAATAPGEAKSEAQRARARAKREAAKAQQARRKKQAARERHTAGGSEGKSHGHGGKHAGRSGSGALSDGDGTTTTKPHPTHPPHPAHPVHPAAPPPPPPPANQGKHLGQIKHSP
jgi:RNA polymerase sigma factor (sigma-70 family)